MQIPEAIGNRLVNQGFQRGITSVVERPIGIPGIVFVQGCTDDGGFRETLPAGDIRFTYREARLPEPGVVTGVQFRLSRTDPGRLRALLQKDAAARRERQPYGLPCAGSIFRNPPGDRAGRLIEASGLKGHRVGGAQVSEVHGNFFVNQGGATAEDLLSLIEEVRAEVFRKNSVELVLELNVIGEEAA